MKGKFNALVACAIMALTAFLVTSCESDWYYSDCLAGEWEGYFDMRYTINEHGYQHTYESYDTHIVFYPEYDGATYGYGYQIDYYNYGPRRYQNMRFEWKVLDHVIYLRYPYNHEWDTQIHTFRFRGNTFEGYFGPTNTSKFILRKLYDFDWSPYRDRDFGYGANPYYTPKQQ